MMVDGEVEMRRVSWALVLFLAGAMGLVSCSEDKVTSTGDSTDPSVRMMFPTSTALAPKSIVDSTEVYVAARDDGGIARVELWAMVAFKPEDNAYLPQAASMVDGAVFVPLDPTQVPDTTATGDTLIVPAGHRVYMWHWDTRTEYENGWHVRLFARAFDQAGNSTRGEPCEVIIDNKATRRQPRPVISVIDPPGRRGQAPATFTVSADSTKDVQYSPDKIEVRWDFGEDNTGDWDWGDWDSGAPVKYATDRVQWIYASTGLYNIRVQARRPDLLNPPYGEATVTVEVFNTGGDPNPPEPENMVLVGAGLFQVGAPPSQPFSSANERPIHDTRMTYAFYIERTEVTNRLYLRYLAAAMQPTALWPPRVIRENDVLMLYPNRVEPAEEDSFPNGVLLLDPDKSALYWNAQAQEMQVDPAKGTADDPVVGVTWYGAKAYAEEYGLRLPTEHEWEIASRGQHDGTYVYPWGATISSTQANYYSGTTRPRLVPRGSYPGSVTWCGLLDVVGNAAEWTKDWYYQPDEPHDPYNSNPDARGVKENWFYPYDDQQTNPEGPILGAMKVVRGGSFLDTEWGVRTTARSAAPPREASSAIGFRTAYTSP
jgi:formylglycine-generating enzyme required for sulfatase activity